MTFLQGTIRHEKYPHHRVEKYPRHRVALGEVPKGAGCDCDCHEMELVGDDPVVQDNDRFITGHS